MFKLSVADLDSPSYFVAVAAADLGFFKQEGLDVELMREFGARTGPERLRDGALHFFGGPAYAATRAFPAWKGAKLLCALSQYSYWFLAVRADLDVKRGDLGALKGLRISSSMELPVLGLRHLLAESGLNVERGDTQIVPAPPTQAGRFMGHAGVEAIRQNLADGYWGNGMRVALGEKAGVAKVHLDLRRGDGPPGARWYNFAALTTTERLIEEAAASRRRRGARDREDAEGAQSRSVAGDGGRRTPVPARGSAADRRPDRARRAVLRCEHFTRSRRGLEQVRLGQRAHA